MSLHVAFEKLKESQPSLRVRDAASVLGVSEAEVVEAQVGKTATRLRPEWKEILFAAKEIGPVMALTRNDAVVLEIDDSLVNLSFDGQMGLAVEPGFDLRIFLFVWAFGFAVEQQTTRGLMQSLQFFDAEGVAVFKIWLRAKSNVGAFHALVERFATTDEPPIQTSSLSRPLAVAETFDEQEFHQAWRALKDIHEFFPMLRAFKLPRIEAIRRAPAEFVKNVPVTFLRTLLDELTKEDLEIMFFVGSRGLIEIFTGRIHTTKHTDGWWNVLDKGLNLHIDQSKLKEAWIVRKPSQDGNITALEVFDFDDNLVLSVFGAREPQKPEMQAWRDMLDRVTGM